MDEETNFVYELFVADGVCSPGENDSLTVSCWYCCSVKHMYPLATIFFIRDLSFSRAGVNVAFLWVELDYPYIYIYIIIHHVDLDVCKM